LTIPQEETQVFFARLQVLNLREVLLQETNVVWHPCRHAIAAAPVMVLVFAPALLAANEGVAACDWTAPELVTDCVVFPLAEKKLDSVGVPLAVLDRDLEAVSVEVSPPLEATTPLEATIPLEATTPEAATDAPTDPETAREIERDWEKVAVEDTDEPPAAWDWTDPLWDTPPEDGTAADPVWDTPPVDGTATPVSELETDPELVSDAAIDRDDEIVFKIESEGLMLGGVIDKVSEAETLVVRTIVPVIKGWTLQW